MKKLFTGILASTMLLSTLSMTAMAQETQETPQTIQTATLASSFDESTGVYTIYNHASFDYDKYSNAYNNFNDEYMLYDDYFLETYSDLGNMSADDISRNFVSVSLPSHLEDQVKTVVIEDGVVGIKGHLSSGFTSVYIPKSLKFVGICCFSALAFEHTSTGGSGSTLDRYAPTEMNYFDAINLLNDSVFWSGYYYDASTLTTVYYEGSEADRANMIVSGGYTGSNYPFMNATWMYNSTGIGTGTPEGTPAPTFPDWTTAFIDFVADDIMPDISTTNYENASNRGLIAQSLFRMCGDGGTYTSNFTDAGSNASAIGWCYKNGVMSGNSETWFDAEGNVTREQFCLILKQMASVQGKTTQTGDVSSLEGYSDSWSISFWAEEGVAWAVANGLMTGSNNALNPHGNVTRLEVAIMLNAFDNL